ncbi:MAG: holo-ACP synthase [Magnetospiraceae bacterium]
MIIGLGTDLCDARRIEATLKRHGDRFTARICTDRERQRADRRQNRASAYALLFAAKEACAKALGTGFRQGVFWRDMEVRNRPSGRPYLNLTGGAYKRLTEITPPGFAPMVEISMTDEFPLAQSIVIVQALDPTLAASRID